MLSFSKAEIFNSSVSVAFNVVADIEKYHEFMKDVKPVKVIETGDDFKTVIFRSSTLGSDMLMTIQFNKDHLIRVSQHQGPFEIFSGEWTFAEEGENTVVRFFVEMKHKNFIKNKAIKYAGKNFCERMVKDLGKRADGVSSVANL